MLKWMRKRLSDDSGFTLIELMVVVLIIAVLVAIAIPSFIGFRNRAQDRAAQSELRNVLLAEQAHWTDDGIYTSTQADLTDYEPSIVLGAGAVVVDEVGAATDAEQAVCMERTSASGAQFAIWTSNVDGTFYGQGASTDDLLPAVCTTTAPTLGTVGTVTWSNGGW